MCYYIEKADFFQTDASPVCLMMPTPGTHALSCRHSGTKLEKTSLSTGGCKCPFVDTIRHTGLAGL